MLAGAISAMVESVSASLSPSDWHLHFHAALTFSAASVIPWLRSFKGLDMLNLSPLTESIPRGL